MVKIMLVDDHKLVRDGIKSLLESDHQYQIVAQASNGQRALDILKTIDAEIILMDINMDIMDGINCTKGITRLYPDKKVIALTMMNDTEYIKQMMKAGAVGYLLKDCNEEELKNTIDLIIKQGSYFSPIITNSIMKSFHTGSIKTDSQTPVVSLTDREMEVLSLIVKEYSNKEIAAELFISLRTVDTHKRNLLEKTKAKNVAGLVLYAIKNQLFDDL